MKVIVEKATPEKAKALGTASWPTWTCDVSEFDWSYDEQETCHVLEGQVEVVTAEDRVKFGAGDLVVFPQGLSCRWIVTKPVRKHYKFG
jgi:uncharacterized cupin superfamily protein